ncbi:hypothetical protein BVRB_8g201650 [Beta vulgaris subsp. vulgaris]|uniref:Uncharacterized protein n=1 Tax=Beta vulgaris subsp. vulgaris TaxID=3555 RepID=A0A0J8E0H2_BETVV|nr:hypothetical protein BVRB_8g201650 [Beta vulgaris subsp. vulgaris]
MEKKDISSSHSYEKNTTFRFLYQGDNESFLITDARMMRVVGRRCEPWFLSTACCKEL